MKSIENFRSNEKGFTLVELSIVMIIIGLLIGGILKGQELIANARLASAVSKVKAVDAAFNTFRDSYAGIPGDVLASRLPNCSTSTVCGFTPIVPGPRGDGIIGIAGNTGGFQIVSSENIIAWAQLAAVDLIGGVSNTGSNMITAGVTVPNADIPGQIYLGYEGAATVPVSYAGGGIGSLTAARAGHYVLIHQGITGPAPTSLAADPATTGSLLPSQASRLDTKLDDGKPNSGSVLAMGTAGTGSANCSDAAGNAGIYNMAAATTAVCGVYIRIQQ